MGDKGNRKREHSRNGLLGILPFSMLRLLLRQCVDLAGEARLLTCCAVLVEDLVGSSLIDRLAGKTQAGLRFVDIARLDSLEDAAGSRADTGLLSSVLCVALCVGFHTKDRSFDVRQVIHPLIFRTILEYDSMPPGKKQPLFLAACDFRRCGAGSAAGTHGRGFLATGAAGMI